MALRQLHVGAVDALALLDLVQTHAEQNDVGVLRQRHGFLLQGVVCLALPLKALRITRAHKAALGQTVEEGIHLDGVDGTGTGPLIPGRLGEVADDGHLLARFQGQDAALILEQNDALPRRAAGQRMMGVGVKGAGGRFDGGLGVQHQLQQLVQPGVHVRFRNFAAFHGLHQLPDGVVAGEGHLQRGAVLHAEGVVVGAAPVGDDGALEAPVLPQDVLEQMGVLVGIGAVDEVVGGHDGLRLCLFDHDLKAGEVDLPQGALVHDGVAGHPAQLLTVHREVLGAGRDAVLLDAADIARRHFTGQIGVLREILEVAAAQRAALDVQAGAQQDRNFLCGGFLAHGLADGLAQGGVPAVCHGGGRREAGCGHTGVQAQMVRRARLFAHAVGAVRQGDGGDVFARQRAGVEHRPAGKQGAFLFQIQCLNDVCVFHRIFLFVS